MFSARHTLPYSTQHNIVVSACQQCDQRIHGTSVRFINVFKNEMHYLEELFEFMTEHVHGQAHHFAGVDVHGAHVHLFDIASNRRTATFTSAAAVLTARACGHERVHNRPYLFAAPFTAFDRVALELTLCSLSCFNFDDNSLYRCCRCCSYDCSMSRRASCLIADACGGV